MEDGTLKLVGEFIRQVGIPTALAFWLLMRTDRRIEEQTKAIRALIAHLKGQPEDAL